MYQNHRIAKQLTLNPLNELVRVLKYKTEWKRNYEYPKCHNELERNLNASINIMFKRIKQYMKII